LHHPSGPQSGAEQGLGDDPVSAERTHHESSHAASERTHHESSTPVSVESSPVSVESSPVSVERTHPESSMYHPREDSP
jgi:hypothetical protein